MFLTATNKKVYVWHMEHLDSLVLEQNQLQQQAFHLQISRPKSAMSASSDSSYHSGPYNSQDSCDQQYSSPQTPVASTSSTSLNTMESAPETPALSIAATSSCSSTGSSYFYPSESTSSLSMLFNTEPSSPGGFDVTETRVQPRLTAVLNMAMDMWCGNVTKHDPPLLILGSRNSTTKLVTLSLTKDIIDSNKDYEPNYVPLQVFPKPAPVQGMPDGHGRGIMCIDTDASKLIVGCTGGAIHIMNMDPSMRALQPLRASQAQVAIVTLPHLTPIPMESVRSVSPIQPPISLAIATSINGSVIHIPGTTISGLSPTSATPHSATSFPRRPPAIFRSNATNVMTSRFSLPTPEQSPMTSTIPLILSATTTPVGEPGCSTKTSLSLNALDVRPYEDQQEVLVTDEDDEDAIGVRQQRIQAARARQRDQIPETTEIKPVPGATSTRSSKVVTVSAASSVRKRNGSLSPSPPRSSPHPKAASSSLSSSPSSSPSVSSGQPPLSGLSKYIPNPPARIMMRRRASSNALAHQAPKSPSSPNGNCMSAASLMRGRNRSDSDLLSAYDASATTESSAASLSSLPAVSTSSSPSSKPKSTKSWTLSSPWNSPSKRTTKSK